MAPCDSYFKFFYDFLGGDEMREFYRLAKEVSNEQAKEYLRELAVSWNVNIKNKYNWPSFHPSNVSNRKFIDILASKGITKNDYLPKAEPVPEIKPIEPRDDFNDAISYALQNKSKIHREMLDKAPIIGMDLAAVEARVMANYGEQVHKMLEVMYGDSRIVMGPRYLSPHEEAPLVNPLLLLC